MKYKVKKMGIWGGEEREYLESWSLGVDFFSTPRTTASKPRTPTAAFPLRTASRAYSTWNKWPSGENTVIARSYRAISLSLSLSLLSSSSSLALFLLLLFSVCDLSSERGKNKLVKLNFFCDKALSFRASLFQAFATQTVSFG